MSAIPSAVAPTARPIPISEFAAELFRKLSFEGCRRTTIDRNRHVLNQVVEAAGVRTSADLNDEAVRRFIEGQPTGQSPHTFWSKLSSLQALLNNAVRWGLLDASPQFPPIPQVVERGPGNQSQKPALTSDDVARFLRYLRSQSGTWEGHRLYALATTAACTDLLKMELLLLRVDDVDLAGATIHVPRRKEFVRSSRTSTVRIGPELAPVLKEWRPRADSEWLFPNKTRSGPWIEGGTGGKPIDRLQEAGKTVSIPGITFEALRQFHLRHAAPSLGLDLGGIRVPVAFPHQDGSSPVSPVPAIQPGQKRDATAAEAMPPSPLIETSAPRRTRPILITADEATRLMTDLLRRSGTWEGHRLYALVGVALLTGLRRGKVLRLRVDDVDLTHGELRIAGRPIAIPLHADARAILADWIPRIGSGPWLFPGVLYRGPWIGGRPGEKPSQKLRNAGRAVGLEGLNFEALRHLHHRMRMAGQIVLGEAFRSASVPERDTEGPVVRRPGPRPGARPRPQPAVHPEPLPRRSSPPEVIQEVVSEVVPVVVLRGSDECPLVLGQETRRPLTKAQRRVIEALDNARPKGLSKFQLMTISRSGDANGVVRRLRESDPLWRGVLRLPGEGGKAHYRIEAPK